jgi:molecular chaperone DnaK
MVFQTEKALEEAGDKLDAADKSKVEADLQALKDMIAAADPENMTEAQVEEMKAAKETLMTSAQNLFTKMYEQAQQAAGPDMGAGADTADTAYNADDVVDGDYKEV